MQKVALVLIFLAVASDTRRVQTSLDKLERSEAEAATHEVDVDTSSNSLAQLSAAFVPGVPSTRSSLSNPNLAQSHYKVSNIAENQPGIAGKSRSQRADVRMEVTELEKIQFKVKALNELIKNDTCDEACEVDFSALQSRIPELAKETTSREEKQELRRLQVQIDEDLVKATVSKLKKRKSKETHATTSPTEEPHATVSPTEESHSRISPTEESSSWFSRLSKRNAFILGVANTFSGIALACRNKGASLREALPPKKELKKMLPLAFMLFCILFNYTVLRDTKDVLVVTSGGAEVIPFLKTYVNLPAAIGVTVLYSSMVNRMSGPKVFYTFVAAFAAFFAGFAGLIYPNLHVLHPTATAANLAASLPSAFGPFISMFKFWTFGAFYTLAQLWGSVVVSLLFWGFANEVCSVSEAKRWYPLFGMLANVALIFSGQFVRAVSDMRSNLPVGVDPWGYSLKILMSAVVVVAGMVMLTYRFMQRQVLTDPECVPQDMEKKTKKKKPKMGLGESFKYLVSSSYIRNLAFLVICYGTSINIVEVTWKGKLRQAFSDPNAYSSFMGTFSSCTGAVTLFMMILSRWMLGRFGWGAATLVTPAMLGITGIGFFSLILFQDTFAPLTAAIGLTPLMMAVLVGAAQNILSKGAKYSFFEPCKETAIIPLDSEMRTKGKAAIDVIGNPLGKSGGSFIQQLAIMSCGSLAASSPFLAGVLFVMIGLWVKASKDLAVEFEERAAATEKDPEDDKQQPQRATAS